MAPWMTSSSVSRVGARRHLLDRNDERRVAGDPGLAADDLSEPRECPQTVLRPRLRHVALEPLQLLWGPLSSRQPGELVLIDAGVPELEVARPGETSDRLSVGTRHSPVDRLPPFGVEASIPASHSETGHQPFHVPLERARQRLVEVVDAEHQPPIGGGENTEVGQMRIATELHVQPGPRRTGQIGRHRVGRAAEERERRHQHPPVADRQQLAHPRSGLLLQQLDRIAAIRGGLPFTMPGARRHRPRRLALCRPLPSRGMGYRLRLGLAPVALPRRHGQIRLVVVTGVSQLVPVGCPNGPRSSEGVLNVRHHAAPFAAGRDLQTSVCAMEARLCRNVVTPMA